MIFIDLTSTGSILATGSGDWQAPICTSPILVQFLFFFKTKHDLTSLFFMLLSQSHSHPISLTSYQMRPTSVFNFLITLHIIGDVQTSNLLPYYAVFSPRHTYSIVLPHLPIFCLSFCETNPCIFVVRTHRVVCFLPS